MTWAQMFLCYLSKEGGARRDCGLEEESKRASHMDGQERCTFRMARLRIATHLLVVVAIGQAHNRSLLHNRRRFRHEHAAHL